MSEKEKQQATASPESSLSSAQSRNWIEAQDLLKRKLIKEDDFTWRIANAEKEGDEYDVELKYIGGVDISFSKEDPSIACGTIVVLDFKTLQVVYDDFSLVTLQVPYVPGFLAFREAPVLLELLERMKKTATHFYPQLLMVDGNGILHPRGFGLACHLGVLANLPTIGIGKNAMRSTLDSFKPIYISIGHRVSLDTAIRIVKMTCKYRIPEPIRQADIRSREYLRKL